MFRFRFGVLHPLNPGQSVQAKTAGRDLQVPEAVAHGSDTIKPTAQVGETPQVQAEPVLGPCRMLLPFAHSA